MNRNQREGGAKVVLGKVEATAGDELGDPLIRARGEVLKVEGRVQEAAGSVQEALGQVSRTARGVVRTIQDEPFMAAGVGVAIGLLAGLFIAAKRSTIIYVKPRA